MQLSVVAGTLHVTTGDLVTKPGLEGFCVCDKKCQD